MTNHFSEYNIGNYSYLYVDMYNPYDDSYVSTNSVTFYWDVTYAYFGFSYLELYVDGYYKYTSYNF